MDRDGFPVHTGTEFVDGYENTAFDSSGGFGEERGVVVAKLASAILL